MAKEFNKIDSSYTLYNVLKGTIGLSVILLVIPPLNIFILLVNDWKVLLMPMAIGSFIWLLSFVCFVIPFLFRRSTYNLLLKTQLIQIMSDYVLFLKIPFLYLFIGNVLFTILSSIFADNNTLIHQKGGLITIVGMFVMLNGLSFLTIAIGKILPPRR